MKLDSRIERDYGSFSSRRPTTMTNDWTEVVGPESSDKVPSKFANKTNGNKKVWQWRGRTITFGGSKRIKTNVDEKSMPERKEISPRARWGGKVGVKKPKAKEVKEVKLVLQKDQILAILKK